MMATATTKTAIIIAPNKISLSFATINKILYTLVEGTVIFTTLEIAKQFDHAYARPRSWLLDALEPGHIDLLIVVGYAGATDMITKARRNNIDIDIYREA